MDREYYYRKQAQAQQATVRKELAARQLLREAGLDQAARPGKRPLVLQSAPVAILLGLLRFFRLVT